MPAEPCPPRVHDVGQGFAAAVHDGRLDLPLPGSGGTLQRWRALVDLAADDLCVARLAEAHLDALAILAELGGPPAAARHAVGRVGGPPARRRR